MRRRQDENHERAMEKAANAAEAALKQAKAEKTAELSGLHAADKAQAVADAIRDAETVAAQRLSEAEAVWAAGSEHTMAAEVAKLRAEKADLERKLDAERAAAASDLAQAKQEAAEEIAVVREAAVKATDAAVAVAVKEAKEQYASDADAELHVLKVRVLESETARRKATEHLETCRGGSAPSLAASVEESTSMGAFGGGEELNISEYGYGAMPKLLQEVPVHLWLVAPAMFGLAIAITLTLIGSQFIKIEPFVSSPVF